MKAPVTKLLKRLKDKKLRDLHTNGFDIPQRIISKISKKHVSWQEDDIDVENIEPLMKRSKVSMKAKSDKRKCSMQRSQLLEQLIVDDNQNKNCLNTIIENDTADYDSQ